MMLPWNDPPRRPRISSLKSVDAHSIAYIPSGRGTAKARVTCHQPLRSASAKNACITRAGGAWINCVRVTSSTLASVAIRVAAIGPPEAGPDTRGVLLIAKVLAAHFLERFALLFPHRH